MVSAGIFGSARVTPISGPTPTFQQSAVSATDLTAYTFTSQPIGTASATRRVVVAVASRNPGIAVSTLTIGGVSASRDASNYAAQQFAEIWSAVVASGTTADVVVTMTGAVTGCGIGVWTLSGGSATGQTASSPTNTATLSMSVTTSSGDVVIGVSSYRATTSAPNASWAAATERYDATVDGTVRQHSGAELVASGASSDMSVTISNFTTDSAACAAAYR